MEGGGGPEEVEAAAAAEGLGVGGGEANNNNNKVKRQMKTAFQLDILEKTYSEDQYPSDTLRAHLSVKLGLTDRQLQMWFCHRRLKDRKTPLPPPSKTDISADFKRQPHLVSEARALAFVEAQLGGCLRQDAPILGMEFDPLPPGAFGAPIDVQQNTAVRPYEAKLYERQDGKPDKGGVKAVLEYQFLPKKPSVRSDSYDRAMQSQYYGSPTDVVSRSHGHSFTQGNDQIPPSGYSLQGCGNLLPPQQGKSGEFDNVTRKSSSSVSIGIDSPTPLGSHPITGIENAFATPSVTNQEDVARMERKRKSEEARIAKEVEAHEKRIRKELEKQDMLRRKKEEQMRKEMERHDRERRKEEERLLREKQREEERYQREQRREMERRVKFLQKESIRAEKLRLKEDMRKEKEAARLKAANDRAAARRIAKESTELIDDERLELMEIAASSKGLPSMLSLDSETLESIESLRDMLPEFPPKSVHLKRPIQAQPWNESEENIGNLLMVWKFLITFADVLGLWPFTLDEFVQAFHDHDPRLLGEVHVALLKSIFKDIEDVARATSSSLGPNQVPNPGGGHPQIVEGAYAWGFDIRSWQRHLNPLTWPEILRQFALAAGFGPNLKKRNAYQSHPCEENEGTDGGDIISSLRSGVAAENALAIMQERGFSNRRSRHRLTPGTVKYAAFHVLSLEGSRGLSILDVADKIQKSGLRDLTTSKTPEASIAAALSRDTKLFERTAPSTYCLKSPYRKDPADGESIIDAAREKIHIFKNGLFDAEEVFDAERVDAEKDDDSESDVPDDPEVGIGNSGVKSEAVEDTEVDFLVDQSNVDGGAHGTHKGPGDPEEDTAVDESISGEPWVQGLMEGEYSDLSVEERLNALVALIAIANEGNSIRIVLEERLETAIALKKQMWAEAQVDRRRMKEDFILKIQYPSVDDLASNNYQENLGDLQNNLSDPSERLLEPVYTAEKSRSQLKAVIGHKVEELYVYRSLPLGHDRRRNRYWQFITSASQNDPGCGRIFVELWDGRWRLIDSEESFNVLMASLDVRGNREAQLHSMLQRVEVHFKEAVNKIPSLGFNSPGSTLLNPNTAVSKLSSFFGIGLGQTIKDMNDALKRYEDFEKWMWGECLNLRAMKFGNMRCEHLLRICDNCRDLLFFENDLCSSCHKQSGTSLARDLTFAKHISKFKEKLKWDSTLYFRNGETGRPVRLRLLKTQLALIEGSVPVDALQLSWTYECRKTWCLKLVSAATMEALLEALTLLESAIKRDFLSLDFEMTDELLGSNNSAMLHMIGNCSTVSILPWLPETTSSVALRLMELDTSICYLLSQKEDDEKDKGATSFPRLHPKYAAVMNNIEEVNHSESLFGSGDLQDPWADPGTLGRGRGRGRSRARGGRSQRSVGGIRYRARTKTADLSTWKGQGRGSSRGGRKRGRRGLITNQQKTVRIANDGDSNRHFLYEESPVVGFQEWNSEEIADLHVNENASSEYEAENDNNMVDEYDDMLVDHGYRNVYDGRPSREYIGKYGLEKEDDVEEDADDAAAAAAADDDDDDDDDDEENEPSVVDVHGFFNDDTDENQDADHGGKIENNPDDETDFSSSGYGD